MKDKELKRWLLLTYARPVHCQYDAQTVDKYKPGHKQHEFETQDTVVLQQAEFPHTSRTGREHDTMIEAVSCVGVNAENRLEVSICDDPDSHIFFEKIQAPVHHANLPAFPEYIKEIITEIGPRTLIYIPPVFVRHLRNKMLSTNVFIDTQLKMNKPIGEWPVSGTARGRGNASSSRPFFLTH
jgi:hypothetical protein